MELKRELTSPDISSAVCPAVEPISSISMLSPTAPVTLPMNISPASPPQLVSAYHLQQQTKNCHLQQVLCLNQFVFVIQGESDI